MNKTSANRLYVTAGVLHGLIVHLRKHRAPVRPVLEGLGLSEEDLADIDRLVPQASVNTAFAMAERITGDHNIGLHSGQLMSPADLGLFGHLIMTGQTVGAVFELCRRSYGLVCNSNRIKPCAVDGLIGFEMEQVEGASAFNRHAVEAQLAFIMSIIRHRLVGTGVGIARIEFPFSRPQSLAEQQHFFNCPLVYDARRFRILVPAQFVSQRLRHSGAEFRDKLEEQARTRLVSLSFGQIDADPLIAEVKRFVAENLYRGVPPIERVAGVVGMSQRGFQRYLSSRDTNYSDIVEKVRKTLADRYVRNRELSLVTIALMLGFAHQSTFQRAFLRWFSSTPRRYRRALSPLPIGGVDRIVDRSHFDAHA